MLLPIHIVAAGLALVTGAVVLSVAKGGRLHRKSGRLFVYAIAAMCGTATMMAMVKGHAVNVMAGLMTGYLAIVALTTVRPGAASSRRRDVGLMLMALVLGLATIATGFAAIASVSGRMFGYPPFPFFLFGVLGLSGAFGDFQTIRSGGLRGAPRLSRHLWRMCMALWITTVFFFSIGARVAAILPAPFATPVLRALPILLVLVAMFYWLWRVRFRRTNADARWPSSAISQNGMTPATNSAPTV